MSFYDLVIGNVYILLLFRAVLLAVGLLELYRFMKKNTTIEERYSWKPAVLQEAMSNLFMIGILVFVFILIVWMDYSQEAQYFGLDNFNLFLIPIDVLLGLFVVVIHLIPKRFVIATEGFHYHGSLTKWEDVLDYHVVEKRGVLTLKHWSRLFTFSYKTESHVPLPAENQKAMVEALEAAMGKKEDKKKKMRGKKKDKEEEEDEAEEEKEKPKATKKKLTKKQQLLLTDGERSSKKGKSKSKKGKK